jgi:trk system potassium uptake protein TrkA
VLVPSPDDPLEAGDELILVVTSEVEDEVRAVILGADSVERTRSSVIPRSGRGPRSTV